MKREGGCGLGSEMLPWALSLQRRRLLQGSLGGLARVLATEAVALYCTLSHF